jgi:hypothetical protein
LSAPRLARPAALTLLALASAATVAVSRPPDQSAGPPLFAGDGIPAPPWQKKPWAAPKTTIPAKFVAAFNPLFEQGFADPRGCEYREVRVAVGNYLGAEVSVILTHGWVLPGKPADGPRFVVCWDGLVYPAVLVGGKADLKADVAASVKGAKGDEDAEEFESPGGANGRSIWHRRLGQGRCVALLLRSGETELAERVWNDRMREGEGDPYLSLAAEWAEGLLDRGLCARLRGDDRLALHDLRLLNAVAPLIEAEARKRRPPPEPGKEAEPFLTFLGQLPEVLADQRRRARAAPHPPVVCLGPGREPDPARRIAALIDRLDEVSGRYEAIYLGLDPIIAALVREGEPAVEPVLRCFESDTRLIRAVPIERALARNGAVLTVHEAAHAALCGLLGETDFEPHEVGDLDRDEARKELARQVREYLKAPRKRESPAERLFRSLADDKAEPDQWVGAAVWLTEPEDAAPGDRPRLRGESLRAKKNPSLTELIVKRAGEVSKVSPAADLALALRCWDEKAALPLLADLTPRCREAGEWYRYQELIAARRRAGDHKGLDDYVKRARALKPDMLKRHDESDVFRPMWENPKYPGMAEAAEWLFTDRSSPWVPLIQGEGTKDRLVVRSPGLLASPLLALAGFRKAVRVELANKGAGGTVQAMRGGIRHLDLEGIVGTASHGWSDPELPRGIVTRTFRICDWVAYLIGENIDGAPRCEVYWPEKRRDAAVAACVEFLNHYGDSLGSRGDMRLPRLDRPATQEQARKGEAIFSLEGEGEVRTVRLPAFPVPARWVTLKERPYQERSSDPETGKVTTTLSYRQDGKVYQAEEVFKGGQWRRYFGFVGSHRVARVPAGEIEFPPPEEDWRSATWVRLADGIDGRLRLARPQADVDGEWVPRWPAGAAPSCALELWNCSGTGRPPPELKGVRPRLYYSPEVVSRRGELVPAARSQTDWEEIKPRPSAALKVEAGRPLPPAEKVTARTLDVRDWFELARPGFYRLVLPSDKGELKEQFRFSVAPVGRGRRHPLRDE